MNKPKLTIIDYSSLYYSAIYSCSNNEDKTDNFKEYRDTLDFYTKSVITDTNAEFFICVGDENTSFRKRMFPTFKKGRSKSPKFFKELKEYATKKYAIITSVDLEADDLALIIHSQLQLDYDITIASIDSDLRQYPAKFFNYSWRRKAYKENINTEDPEELKLWVDKNTEVIDYKTAKYNLWKMVLKGSHNNNQYSLPGCGEKTAESFLNDSVSMLSSKVSEAFIYGVDKNAFTNIKRSVKGLGLIKGIEYFNKSFYENYLLRSIEEVKCLEGISKDIETDISKLTDIKSRVIDVGRFYPIKSQLVPINTEEDEWNW